MRGCSAPDRMKARPTAAAEELCSERRSNRHRLLDEGKRMFWFAFISLILSIFSSIVGFG